jgi:dephospho-CoA kinase
VIAQQAPREARRACADAVIFNDRLSMDDLRQQVQALVHQFGLIPHDRRHRSAVEQCPRSRPPM